jgi:hypothetical protein
MRQFRSPRLCLAALWLMGLASVPGNAQTLPGEFIIRTYVKNTLLSAHDAGNDAPNAVITTATSLGSTGSEKFKLNSVPGQYTTIQTTGGNYLSASGNVKPGNGDPRMALQAYATSPSIGTTHFRFHQSILPPHGHINISRKWPGYFAIQTSTYYWLTAVAGGGQADAAFHTDALKPLNWERYWVLKCGDLGSGYKYAIRPAGTGSPGQPAQSWLLAHVGPQWNMHAYFGFYATHFKFVRQDDGSYALAIEGGGKTNYITADGGGGLASGDNLHTDATQVQAWERFKIVDRGDCTYTIQTAKDWFLAVGPNDVASTRISDPDAAPSIGYNARFELVLLDVWQ